MIKFKAVSLFLLLFYYSILAQNDSSITKRPQSFTSSILDTSHLDTTKTDSLLAIPVEKIANTDTTKVEQSSTISDSLLGENKNVSNNRSLNANIKNSDKAINPYVVKKNEKDSIKRVNADTINYTTDKINYDLKNKKVYFLDNNQIFYKKYTMVADSILMDLDSGITHASKNLFIVDNQKKDTIYLDSLFFNTKTKQGLFYNINGQQDGGIYSGEVIKREDDVNYLGNHFFYTTDLDSNPAHYFYAEKLKLKTESKVAFAKPIVLVVADVPVIPLPLFVKPYNKERRSGFLTPSYGGSESNGREITNMGYYWVIADNIDIEGITDYYEKRGTALQATLRMKTKFNIPNANFYYKRYLNLNSTNSLTGYSDNVSVNFMSYLDNDKKYTLSANGSMASNKSVLQDFEDDQEERLKAQNQSINATFTGKSFEYFGFSAYAQQNANLLRKTSDYTLPSVSINSLPSIRYSTVVPLIYGEKEWFYKSKKMDLTKSKLDNIYLSIGAPRYLRKEHVDDSVSYYNSKNYGYAVPLSLRTKSIDLGPFKLSPSLNFSHVGISTYVDSTLLDSITTVHNTDTAIVTSVKYYTNLEDGSIDSSFFGEREIDSLFFMNTWNTSLSLSTSIYGLTEVKIGYLQAIRHRFNPSLSFTYAEGIEKDQRYHHKKMVVGSVYANKQKSVGYSMSNGWDFKWKTSDSAEVQKYSLLNISSSINYNFEAEDKKLSLLTNSVSFPLLKLVSGNFAIDFYDDDTNLVMTHPTFASYGINFNLPINVTGVIFSGDLSTWNNEVEMSKNRINMSTSLHFSYNGTKIREGIYKTSKNFNTSLSAGVNLTSSLLLTYNTRVDLVTSEFLSHDFALSKQIRRWKLDIRWVPKGTRKMWSMNVQLMDLGDVKYNREESY